MQVVKFVVLGILFFLAGIGFAILFIRNRRHNYIGTLIIVRDEDGSPIPYLELSNKDVISTLENRDYVELSVRIL